MLPRKLTYLLTTLLIFTCVIKNCASQTALGRFQELPVNCYDCTGSDCVDSFPGRINKCTPDATQSCATVFSAENTVIARGCSGAVTELCNSTLNNCYYCQSSGCNVATTQADYITCLDCDTERDVNCYYDVSLITTTRQCLKSCMTALYPRNKTSENPAYELARACLDDYDLDYREQCESGDLENCVPCSTPSCNTVPKVPDVTRHRCLICEGENCEEPEELECPAYRNPDQCFVQFNEQNDISRMGCMSSLDEEYVLENKRRLYTCDEDLCNIYSPTSNTCAACDSEIDDDCIDSTSGLGSTVCNEFPFTQCATFLKADGNIVRDCLSNILDDDLFDQCLSENNTECQSCTGNTCNVNVFPADRQSCLKCDSATDISCDNGSLQYASYCTNYKQGDVCVTSVENGLTRRGCQTDFTCNVDDTKSCRTCDSRDCNTIDLLQNDVGEPGKWQDLPLSCYSCDGIECTSTELNLTTCTGNNLQTCMTVFDINDAIQMRGCSDVVEARYNDFCENNDKCFKCKSNNCNDATAISQFIDCYFCDSSVRKNCAVDFNGGRTRKCKDACMVTLFPSSLTGISAFETQRSCLDDLEKPDQTTCRDGSNNKCSACTSSLCNMEILPADRLECLTCVDDSCQLTVSNKCVSYMENDQCYALFENKSIIDLGCRSNLVADSVELLIKQKKLWVCNENNCNTESNIPQPQSCLVCDSTFDPLCASNPSALTTMETCAETPYTACVTRVTNSGITERGCVSSLSEDEFYECQTGSDALCQVCTGNDCNAANVFPADRLSCHQCDSSTVENCSDSPQSLAICPIYNAQDTCVTTVENTYTVRGCSSSVQCADENNRASCRICDTPGCNTVNLEANFAQGSPGRWQRLPLTCYACNSSTSCNNLDAMTECSVDISQQCMTVFDSAGAVVQRGCRNSVLDDQSTYCDENTDKCLSCNSNKCNAAMALTDYVDCVYCDTERNGNCVNDVADIRTTRKCYGQCMTALYQRANETDPAYGLSRSCLDDLEEEDRQTCIAGQNDNCLACSGTKCNTVDMPEQRLSCLHCEDENCDEPKVRACAQYRNVDQCYIQFDETSSIVRLGCRSDYSNAEADYLLSQKRLLYCDGENCNDLEIVPVAQTCVLCNSRTEQACATNPSRVSGATSCAVLPYTSCYTRTLEDGSTERGCLSSLLDNEFFQCLTNTSDTCSTCSGTSCNSAVYPAERLSCHICDSSTNANCETTPDSLTICPTYDISQTCVSSVRNGITVRGCSADNICDAETSICETCTTVGCNTANVAKKVDDNFGKWQDLPLTCWECTGAECSSATIRENKCSLNNLQDCLTVFDADNNVVRRGCKDQVNAEYGSWCDEHSDKCFNCKSNKCNSATAVSQFVSCVYCDTASDSSCLSNPENITRYRDCQGGCMTALYPRALAADPSYETIRTCLNDKEPADQTTCLAGRDELCATCTTANCNVDKLPQNRLSCYQCYGENCDEPNASLCPLYNANDQCFTLFDEFNSIAEMGCISSFGNMALEEILSTKRVYVCESENCNSMDNIPSPRQCVECDSSVNPLCATNAYEITSSKTCTALPYTSCYTSITEDGFTLRGCVSDLPDDDFKNCVVNKTESCQVCEQDGCNREIFPEDRLQCYTCNSSEDPSCNDDPSKMELCSNFNSATTCVTALLGTNVTVRGCSWDVLCDSTDRSTCRSCSSSGCNSIKLLGKAEDNYHGVWQDLPLKCYTCEGEQCLNSLGVSTECWGYKKQDCMTVFAEDGSVRRRGCSDEVETVEDRYCRNKPNKCFTCKSNDCNIAWNTTEYIECLFCDSSKDPECETHPANVVFPNRTCYKECMVAVKGESLIRSCLDDKEVSDQNLCKANNNECATCEENNCNDFVFPYKQLSCHVCTDERCDRSRSQPCAGSVPNDFCFAKYENNVPVLLGCASTQDPNDLFQLAAQYRLYNCEDNDCNELSKLPVAITCTHCNSTDACAQNPGQVTEMASCNPLQGQCYSLISNDGKTARGCVSDLDINIEYECVREGTCELCGSSTCNNKIYPADRRRCYICKSETDPNCATSPAQSEVCPIFESNDSCVTRLVNGRTERGCGSDLDCDTNDLASCVMCGSDNCNNVQLQENHHNEEHNSASVASFSLTSIVLGLAVILVLQKK